MSKIIRMGLLCTDHVAFAAQPVHGDYPEMFAHLFSHAGAPLQFRRYEVVRQHYPQAVDENDVYLITGSKASVYEKEPWIERLQQYVRELHAYKKPLIGICFGHQLVAQALGGTVERSTNGWGVGVRQLPVLKTFEWMQPSLAAFSILYSHQDQVIKMPAEADCFAGDAFCPHAAMRINSHLVTVQGHPEFTLHYMHYLIDQRRELIGEQRYQLARNSLLQPTDQQIMARWLLQACGVLGTEGQ